MYANAATAMLRGQQGPDSRVLFLILSLFSRQDVDRHQGEVAGRGHHHQTIGVCAKPRLGKSKEKKIWTFQVKLDLNSWPTSIDSSITLAIWRMPAGRVIYRYPDNGTSLRQRRKSAIRRVCVPWRLWGDREITSRARVRRVRFVINMSIRAWSDGNTDERRKRS
jgi:hypothetical protein